MVELMTPVSFLSSDRSDFTLATPVQSSAKTPNYDDTLIFNSTALRPLGSSELVIDPSVALAVADFINPTMPSTHAPYDLLGGAGEELFSILRVTSGGVKWGGLVDAPPCHQMTHRCEDPDIAAEITALRSSAYVYFLQHITSTVHVELVSPPI